jgi:hypothetical protein
MTKTPKRMTNHQTTEIRDEDCMQVDRTKLKKLTKKECKHLRKRRACFFCQKDGHMARECPEKKKTSHSSASGGKPKARTVNIQEEKEDGPPSYKSSVANIHTTICTMTRNKRERLLEKLIKEGSEDEDEKSQADEKDF